MNIINIEHISKLFGDKLIFDDASFGLQEGDKVGIVGINGTGKSTLLRMVAGEETPDSGQIIRQNNLKMAYLPQTPEFEEGTTVLRAAIADNVKESAYKIIKRKKATYYGIAMSVKRICEVILKDEKAILPVSTMMHGAHGIEDIVLSMPAIVGKDGIEKQVKIKLNEKEQEALKKSAGALKKVLADLDI